MDLKKNEIVIYFENIIKKMKTVCKTNIHGEMSHTCQDLSIKIMGEKASFYIDGYLTSTFDCDNSATLDYYYIGTPFYLLKSTDRILFIANNNRNFTARALGNCKILFLSPNDLALNYYDGNMYILNRSTGAMCNNEGNIKIVYFDNLVTIYTKGNRTTIVYYINIPKIHIIDEFVQEVINCEFKYLLKIGNNTYVKVDKLILNSR
jgi:hypothetical protein